MMFFGSPLALSALSPLVRYGGVAALGAFASWYATDWYHDAKYARLKLSHAEALAEAQKKVAESESKIGAIREKVTTRYITKTVQVESASKEANRVIETDPTPALTDPRCAWPDSVRDAVNRARATGATGTEPATNDAVRGRAPRDERAPR
jgi:hypothetical protein